MDLLLIGSGGREHAIARKLAKSDKVNKIYCAPGNGGTHLENKTININITDIEELKEFALKNKIDLTIVGPEQPLINGIVDEFKKVGLTIFGPDKLAAKLEGSKSFSKNFMKKYSVKTAKYETFTKAEEAIEYLKKQEFPIVIKADGLAAGKGVYICENFEDSKKAIKEIMIDDIFDGAGSSVVIEEYLQGFEASILSITDGKIIKPFISAKDHKQIFDGDKGPNTGGMGVIAPNPYLNSKILKDFEENIMEATLKGIKEEKFDFKGIIFFGIMVTEKGCYLLEYNVRMGDPETQSVLELMDFDFLDLINSTLKGTLEDFNLKWSTDYCCNVVMVSGGYPGIFEKNYLIEFKEEILDNLIFAGAKYENNKLKTSGGRVVSVIGKGKTKDDAIKMAYHKINSIKFKNNYYRKDIGK